MDYVPSKGSSMAPIPFELTLVASLQAWLFHWKSFSTVASTGAGLRQRFGKELRPTFDNDRSLEQVHGYWLSFARPLLTMGLPFPSVWKSRTCSNSSWKARNLKTRMSNRRRDVVDLTTKAKLKGDLWKRNLTWLGLKANTKAALWT